MRVAFLDIDGVLLPRSAWARPENRAAKELIRSGSQPSTVLAGVRLDAGAVGLAIRLCRNAGARVVVHSSWRYLVGEDAMRAVLLLNGMPEDVFHPDPCAVTSPFSQDKFRDVHEWLHDHCDERVDYVVIDDDAMRDGMQRAVAPDPSAGFAESDYHLARRVLLGEDYT